MTRQATMKIIIGLAFVVLVVPLGAVYAEDPIVFDLTVSDSTNITEYINRFYMSAVAVAGITAVVMIVIGAIYYVVSGGSQDKQREGKDIITSAIWGVVLLLGAYTILNTVNPELVSLSPPGGERVTIYSCGEENLVKNVCVEDQSPVPDNPDDDALCCVPGLGYIPPPTASSCPINLTEACTSSIEVSADTNIWIADCYDCSDTWNTVWYKTKIKRGSKYLQWTYYPQNGISTAASLGENGYPPVKEAGAACVVYSYQKEELFGDDLKWVPAYLVGLKKCL